MTTHPHLHWSVQVHSMSELDKLPVGRKHPGGIELTTRLWETWGQSSASADSAKSKSKHVGSCLFCAQALDVVKTLLQVRLHGLRVL